MSRFERPALELDGEWRFIRDRERIYRPGQLPDGEPILVPGCWEAQVAQPYGIITAWYRRGFDLPADWTDGRVLLHFGAVLYDCKAWLNGQEVGGHEGGYTPFTLEVQEAVRAGESNDLVVRVVNPMNALEDYPAFDLEAIARAESLEPDLPISEIPHGKQTWYTSTSGIWQSVRLEHVAPTYLTGAHATPDVEGKRVRVHWTLAGGDAPGRPDGDPGTGPGHRIGLMVTDPGGQDVAQIDVVVGAGEHAGEVDLAIPRPILWDIDRPDLYRLEVGLHRDGELVDGLAERFGMRTIEARQGKVWLNGRPVYLLGALDQDVYATTLVDPPDRAFLKRQMALTREMGFNLLRCHIKIPDPAYLEAADEAGLLVWCELPSWSRFTAAAARRGRETLRDAVEATWNHPSLVAWSIINEDWGTQLRYEARDRRWLRETAAWLRALDPTRLVVDNSACETGGRPNFHLETDLADFHIYVAVPDAAPRWRALIEEFAQRPGWLFSPHGDASPRGDEPLILSEFGTWGLPGLAQLEREDEAPWWASTGQGICRPSAVADRFAEQGLERIWPDLESLAEATQWAQYEAFRYEVGELRRHSSIAGYVVTELTDAYWEANGLLDLDRAPKAYHGRLAAINAPDVVLADLPRRDLWGGQRIEADVILSAWGERPQQEGGTVRWRLSAGRAERSGELPIEGWPEASSAVVGRLAVDVPDVPGPSDASLELVALDGSGRERARDELRLAILPSGRASAHEAVAIEVHDPLGIFAVGDRLVALGHRLMGRDDASLLVTTELRADDLAWLESGGQGLLLARSTDALPPGLGLDRPLRIHARRPPAGVAGQRSPWDGDWVSTFSWLLPDAFPGLPRRAPLDFAYAEVLPEHVLLGFDPARHRDEVPAGIFAGWVQAPAALTWTFPQGRGRLTVTTFRLAPESGPVATVMLDELVAYAAGRSSRPSPVAEGLAR